MEYCYVIRFKNTGEMYLGSKTSKDSDPKQLFNSSHPKPYYTSSKIVKTFIDLYGLDSFEVLKIREFPNGGAYVYESKILKRFSLHTSKYWLNRSCNREDLSNRTSAGTIWINNGNISKQLKVGLVIPEGFTKGRLKPKYKVKNTYPMKCVYHPKTGHNTRVRLESIEYMKSIGYVLGQSNCASGKTWWKRGNESYYGINPPDGEGWIEGRLMETTMLYIKDPRGNEFHGEEKYLEYLRMNDVSSKISAVYRQAKKIGHSPIINIYNFSAKKKFFEFYGFDSSIIGKTWEELGFVLKKVQIFK